MALGRLAGRGGAAPMGKSIEQLNIERFRRLLRETTDEGRRQTLSRLLAEEEAKRTRSDAATREKRPMK
jgi:hypothetical protein